MTERTREEVVERLEWWLSYFNEEADRPRHPDFIENPAGFDETAIEPDLRAAAHLLREMPDGERIEVWARRESFIVQDRGFMKVFTAVQREGNEPFKEDILATLFLHLREPKK